VKKLINLYLTYL